jgi:hypothetical protein
VIVLLSGFFMFAAPATAHAPKAVQLTYDAAAQTLQVAITHSTFFASSHYVILVDIRKNGKTISSYPYTSQPDKNQFSYSYPVQAADGDILEATATCNLFGSTTSSLTVQSKPAKTK